MLYGQCSDILDNNPVAQMKHNCKQGRVPSEYFSRDWGEEFLSTPWASGEWYVDVDRQFPQMQFANVVYCHFRQSDTLKFMAAFPYSKVHEDYTVREITKSSSTFSATNISNNMIWFFQMHDTIKLKSNHTEINYNHNNIAIRSHIMIYHNV